ncbi:MAG: bifunctional 2-keto-4-hydroxyglutarate aldolase/2-keto-3-deoxy-6-phosphogluconate aldolase [Erysipelotrichaceae bacterium]
MNKSDLLVKLKDNKIVAVIRGDNEEQVMKIVEAVYRGGIKFMEITFTIPNAEIVIAHLSEKYKNNDDIIIGAGTCLDIVAARMAISSGAKFVVCPHFDKEIMKLCNTYRISCFPGATTVKDMLECLKYGADVIKLFPGDTFGPKAIKSFKGPLPQADFMPTGGVSVANIKEWLANGAISVGTGGSLTKGAATGDYNQVSEEAAKLVGLVKEYVAESN